MRKFWRMKEDGRYVRTNIPPFSPHIFIDIMFLSLPYFQGSENVRDIPLPEELIFTVDEKVLDDINQAKAQYLKQVDFSLFS